MRVLGIDYGTKRIGLAISDETQTLAREYDILSPAKFWDSVQEIVESEQVSEVVLGWPIGMSGQVTSKTKEVEEFQKKLQSVVPVPVKPIDERLSSAMAAHLAGTDENIDSLAAQIFLQNYLDGKKK